MINEKYALYENLLREWSAKMNLVAPSTLTNIRERHIMDSAQLAEHIPAGATAIDLGSGAGFPAVVLAILGHRVIAIESIAKKCRFLETLKSTLDLPNLTIINDRAENLFQTVRRIKNRQCEGNTIRNVQALHECSCFLRNQGNFTRPDPKKYIITARAFAPLVRIFDWAASTKIPYLLLKGENLESEIAIARKKYQFDYSLIPSQTGPGFILSVGDVKPIAYCRQKTKKI